MQAFEGEKKKEGTGTVQQVFPCPRPSVCLPACLPLSAPVSLPSAYVSMHHQQEEGGRGRGSIRRRPILCVWQAKTQITDLDVDENQVSSHVRPGFGTRGLWIVGLCFWVLGLGQP